MIPKVKFKVAPLEHYIKHICHFLNPGKGDWDWSDRILNNYPKLKNKLRGIKDKKKRDKIVYDFFRELEKNKKSGLNKKRIEFQKEWNKINDKVIGALSKIVEIKWPKNAIKIIAYLTLNPICPRNIKKRTFDVYYKSTIKWMKTVSLHEILHFIYFEKWKQVFPNTNEKEFNGPHLVWQLSEITPAIILKDKKIQDIFKHNPPVYQVYKKTKINGKPLLDYISGFYDKKRDFTDFLKQSWKFVKKYEKKIMKI